MRSFQLLAAVMLFSFVTARSMKNSDFNDIRALLQKTLSKKISIGERFGGFAEKPNEEQKDILDGTTRLVLETLRNNNGVENGDEQLAKIINQQFTTVAPFIVGDEEMSNTLEKMKEHQLLTLAPFDDEDEELANIIEQMAKQQSTTVGPSDDGDEELANAIEQMAKQLTTIAPSFDEDEQLANIIEQMANSNQLL